MDIIIKARAVETDKEFKIGNLDVFELDTFAELFLKYGVYADGFRECIDAQFVIEGDNDFHFELVLDEAQ